jgi:hypothetical protein
MSSPTVCVCLGVGKGLGGAERFPLVLLPREVPPARIVARIADLEDVVEVKWKD